MEIKNIFIYKKERVGNRPPPKDPTPGGKRGQAGPPPPTKPSRPVTSEALGDGKGPPAWISRGWGEVASGFLEGLREELSAQSSRMMGSLVLAGWTGGTGNRGAPRGLSGRADFTFTGRLGRRAARRISRWLRALRRALGNEKEQHGVVRFCFFLAV